MDARRGELDPIAELERIIQAVVPVHVARVTQRPARTVLVERDLRAADAEGGDRA
jgi:hypothetical protein